MKKATMYLKEYIIISLYLNNILIATRMGKIKMRKLSVLTFRLKNDLLGKLSPPEESKSNYTLLFFNTDVHRELAFTLFATSSTHKDWYRL